MKPRRLSNFACFSDFQVDLAAPRSQKMRNEVSKAPSLSRLILIYADARPGNQLCVISFLLVERF